MKPGITFPLLLIVFGALWFLKASALLPDGSTIVALLLIATGLIIFVVEGINRANIVLSPMLFYSGGAVYVYDHFVLKLSYLLSLGMVLLGLLLIIARSERLNPPRTPPQDPERPPF